ncbi:MAG TPA: selenocysteine-specific translation elongation factor [Terriglobales bacterium]|nr:selenocysteine-specific translation elongation factor [Terriglobales bacterium]
MKSVIVGTAGHIDHGKTALVEALTGIDADRLEEEKRRGITIDIGFAHLELPGPGEVFRLGFIDVPGHERFVRNMLAGVGGIDMVLLVIAADESIKPQTREHFDICRLLSIPRGITVLTKSDTIDPETLEVVRLEVEDFVRGSFLDTTNSPIVAVSSKTGAGLEELKRAMVQVAQDAPVKDSAALPRLPIDRVFSMKGFGTVVTGTLVSGTIRKEEEMQVYPGTRRVRVRGVQVHGASTDQAIAGQRTALNLAGAAVEELARGMTLGPPETFHPTARAYVSLSLLKTARPLRDRARVHLHAYTAETVAEVIVHGQKQLAPGQTGYAQLRMAEPMLLLPGDRFILRQFSPVVTIGGGIVLDAAPVTKKVAPEERIQFLGKIASGSREEILAARIARRHTFGLSLPDAVAETGWPRRVLDAVLATLAQRNQIVHAGSVLLSPEAFQDAKTEALAAVNAFHNANPLVAGISKEELREKIGIPLEVFTAVLDAAVRDRKIEISGEQVRAAGRSVVLKDEEAESKKIIEAAFATAGLKVPALKDVLAGVKVDRGRAQKIMTLLLRDKVLVKISEDLVFHRSALDDLRRRMAAQKVKSPKIDVAQFKDLTGVSRKYAIPLLEYLDRERVTRRVGDHREIL